MTSLMTYRNTTTDNRFRYYVSGFTGFAATLTELRERLTYLRDEYNLTGETCQIHRNQCKSPTMFAHVGPVDKTLVL